MLRSSQHIALWACPRSRSTAIVRAFEQLDGCIYDEPLAGAYLLVEGQSQNPPISEAEIPPSLETDYQKIIANMTGEIPNNSTFVFSKNLSQYALPIFGTQWLTKLTNVFLIRHPKETIFSYWKTSKKNHLTIEEVGWIQHYDLFKKIQVLEKKAPIVIDSENLIKSPAHYCQLICQQLGIEYHKKMLTWKISPEETRLLWTKNTKYHHYYADVLNSNGFNSNKKKIDFPEHLVPLLEKCLPLYEELYHYCLGNHN